MTRMENGKTINEGLCLQCAKELGIGPVNELMEKMGITDDEIENMNDQLMGMMDEDGEEIDMDSDSDEFGFCSRAEPKRFPFAEYVWQNERSSGTKSAGNPGKENPSARQKREKGAEAEVFRGILYGFDQKSTGWSAGSYYWP